VPEKLPTNYGENTELEKEQKTYEARAKKSDQWTK
jgi:hypothetical protein